MGRVALSSLYRREIESRVNDAICENAYCNIGLMGGAGPGDDRKKSHHFRDLQQGKGALRHQESFPILVEATYLAPLAIFFFRDEFAADSPLQRRVERTSVREPDEMRNGSSCSLRRCLKSSPLTSCAVTLPPVAPAVVGGSVGAVTGAFSPLPSYAYPYHGHVAHGGCHWIPAHYDAGHKVEHVRFVADSLQWRDVDSNSRSLVETSRQIAPLAFWGVVAR